MGIYIPSMEMPKNCGECPFIMWVDDCPAADGDNMMIRHMDCPLIEVPKHGDLIDRDKLSVFEQLSVRNAPVVIEADDYGMKSTDLEAESTMGQVNRSESVNEAEKGEEE